MPTTTRRHLLAGGSALALFAIASRLDAQEVYPARPVKIVVPFAAGGGVDILTRILVQQLTERLGQSFVVENLTGAGGNIGVQAVAAAPPDGYALVMATTGTHAINPALSKKLPYDPIASFAPIAAVAQVPNLLVVSPQVSATSVKELVALARAKPGAVNFGSFGPGTSNHLSGEMFKDLGGIDIVHVPYRRAPEAITDLISGRIEMLFVNMPLGLPHVQAGKIRALAVTGAKRSPLVPELPTMIEAGVADFVVESWYGLFAPAGTPRAVVAKLHDALGAIVKRPEVVAAFAQQGAETMMTTPEELNEMIKAEIPRWKKIAERIKLSLD